MVPRLTKNNTIKSATRSPWQEVQETEPLSSCELLLRKTIIFWALYADIKAKRTQTHIVIFQRRSWEDLPHTEQKPSKRSKGTVVVGDHIVARMALQEQQGMMFRLVPCEDC